MKSIFSYDRYYDEISTRFTDPDTSALDAVCRLLGQPARRRRRLFSQGTEAALPLVETSVAAR
jgi:hypothetical protein